MVTRTGVSLSRDLEHLIRQEGGSTLTRLGKRAAQEVIDRNLLPQAAYTYRIVPISQCSEASIIAQGEEFHAPRLIPESGELTAIGCAVCTLGPDISEHVTSLFRAKRASLALALDGLSNRLVFVLVRRMLDRMLAECLRQGLSQGVELHAGEPGLELHAQAAVCRLAEAASIGVEVNEDSLMIPIKSRSILIGIGNSMPATPWSRCTDCPSKDKCAHGRSVQATGAAIA